MKNGSKAWFTMNVDSVGRQYWSEKFAANIKKEHRRNIHT